MLHKQFVKWIPKWQENQDPSGRANAAHVKADVTIAIEKKWFSIVIRFVVRMASVDFADAFFFNKC